MKPKSSLNKLKEPTSKRHSHLFLKRHRTILSRMDNQMPSTSTLPPQTSNSMMFPNNTNTKEARRPCQIRTWNNLLESQRWPQRSSRFPPRAPTRRNPVLITNLCLMTDPRKSASAKRSPLFGSSQHGRERDCYSLYCSLFLRLLDISLEGRRLEVTKMLLLIRNHHSKNVSSCSQNHNSVPMVTRIAPSVKGKSILVTCFARLKLGHLKMAALPSRLLHKKTRNKLAQVWISAVTNREINAMIKIQTS